MEYSIKRRVKFLQTQIKQANNEITALQGRCDHPFEELEVKHDSNTGNYDPSADCYWTDFHCKLCDKRWSVDGSHDDIPGRKTEADKTVKPEGIYKVHINGRLEEIVYTEDAAWNVIGKQSFGSLHKVTDGNDNVREEFIPF